MTPSAPHVQPNESVEVVRSEERARIGVERVATRRVLIGKRVVTEERTVTVTVSREELVYREEALQPGAGALESPLAADSETVAELEFVLSEEVPIVTVQRRPRERVRVFRDRVTTQHHVGIALDREEIELGGPALA